MIVATCTPQVSVSRMRLSDGRTDYYVHIQCGDRSLTPYMFRERYKAEYEVASFLHVFYNTPQPDIMAYNEETYPNDT